MALWQVTPLTRVFPFDVGQVGRAGVADWHALMRHALVPIHVHEISRNGDLEEIRDTLVNTGLTPKK